MDYCGRRSLAYFHEWLRLFLLLLLLLLFSCSCGGSGLAFRGRCGRRLLLLLLRVLSVVAAALLQVVEDVLQASCGAVALWPLIDPNRQMLARWARAPLSPKQPLLTSAVSNKHAGQRRGPHDIRRRSKNL